MKIPVGISNRHVHLKEEDLHTLFGENYELTVQKHLTQPGEFASAETVTLEGPKGSIEKVRVLGPVRKYTQIEISKTDSYKLGVKPPVRMSGNLENSETITIIGPKGSVTATGCILAARHIHITEEDLNKYNLKLNKPYQIKVNGEKETILGSVYIKTGNSYFELHLDTDDANAFMLKNGDMVELITDEE